MEAQKPGFLRKYFVTTDSLGKKPDFSASRTIPETGFFRKYFAATDRLGKNPVSLPESVSLVITNSRHVLGFLISRDRSLNFLWVCLSISPSIRQICCNQMRKFLQNSHIICTYKARPPVTKLVSECRYKHRLRTLRELF